MARHQADPLMIRLDLDMMQPGERRAYLKKLIADAGPGGWISLPEGSLDRILAEYGYSDDMPASSKAMVLHPTESNQARAARAAGKAKGAGAKKPGVLSRIKNRFGGKTMGPLAAGVIGSVATAPLFMIMDRLMNGNMEDQMRKQMDIQRKLEMEAMGGQMGGAGGGMAGLVGGQERSMYDLLEDQKHVNNMRRLGVVGDSARNQRGSGANELAALLAGSESRIRDLQAPRMLTNAEIMSILNG